DGSYEHMRKLYKGLAYPSSGLLKEICKVLGLDAHTMAGLVAKDKLEGRFGKHLYVALGHDPRAAQFEELVPHLSQEQVDLFLEQMRAEVRANRNRLSNRRGRAS